jgi:HK97 gp10 family phage protein
MATVRIEGLEGILERLENTISEEATKQSLKKACLVVERSAKQKAPKGDGDLRRSITSEVRQDGADLIGVVFTPLEYAPYVEYGTGLFAESGGRQEVPWNYQDDKGNWHSTSGMKPQPYMRPALNENREKIKQILKEGVTNND